MRQIPSILKYFAVVAFVFFGHQMIHAQQGQNINFLRVVPQSGYINPAIVPPYNFYIGIPGLSSVKIGIENSAFHFKDIVKTRADDSLYIDTKGLLNKLQSKNYFKTEFTNEFLSFGFRIKKVFITFNLSDKFNYDFMYPKDFFSLLINGNNQFLGRSVNIGGFDISATLYHELAVGISYQVSKKFTAGIRGKYLIGIANIDTRKTDINLYSPDEFSTTVSTNIEINSSIPGTTNDNTDSLGLDITDKDLRTSITSLKNSGFAIDLGMQYQISKKMSLGLSVTDVGYINWETGVRNLVTSKENNSFTFNGIHIDNILTDTINLDDQIHDVLDSLSQTLGLKVTYKGYQSYLTPKVYLSGIYSLTLKDHFGGLVRCDILKGNLLPSLTVNYTREFGKAFSLMAGYTIGNNNNSSVGFGFAVNAGPIQLYILTDNVLVIADVTTTRYVNTHFGLNLVFGRKRWYDKNRELQEGELQK